MQYLRAAPGDARILEAVVARAQELRADRDKALADYVAAMTAKNVVPALSKNLSRTVQALWRAARGRG